MSEYFQNGERTSALDIKTRKPFLTVEIDERPIVVDDFQVGLDGVGYIVLDGKRHSFHRAVEPGQVHVNIDGQNLSVKILGNGEEAAEDEKSSNAILAPMPGIIIDISCEAGQSVTQKDVVITIESMKLQSELRAPRDGVIASIDLEVGATFDRDACLISLEPLPVEDAAE